MEVKKYSMDLAGRELTIETGKYCGLANRKCDGSLWGYSGFSQCNSFKRTKGRN